jgi:hypothetical protein
MNMVRKQSTIWSIHVSLLLALLGSIAHAAALTPAQLQALFTDITVNNAAEFSTAIAATNDQAIADAYNLAASPTFWVWKTRLAEDDIYQLPSVDATVWSWPAYILRSVEERAAWDRMFSVTGAVNPSLPNTRQGIADIFSGAGGAAQRTHLLAMGRRTALRIEKLYATGTGSPGSPGVMAFEGAITYLDIAHAFGRGY